MSCGIEFAEENTKGVRGSERERGADRDLWKKRTCRGERVGGTDE